MEVRPESPADIPAIYRVNEAAFDGRPVEAQLVDLLRARGKALLSLVAVVDDQVVGHALFSPVTLDPPRPAFHAVGLAPVAVSPEFQRGGIGSRLIREGLERCRAAGYEAVVVLGHAHYYPRFGFRPASEFGLGDEYDAGDHFMALELRPGALQGLTGVVKYAPEFAEAGT